MDEARAAAIVRSLAAGRDPATGVVLSENDVLQRPEVIRALFLSSLALEGARRQNRSLLKTRGHRRARDPSLPASTGLPWAEGEDDKLGSGFDGGLTEVQLAEVHQRTVGAIRARLIKLGKIEPHQQF